MLRRINTSIRLDDKLLSQLRKLAKEKKLSLNSMVEFILRRSMEREIGRRRGGRTIAL